MITIRIINESAAPPTQRVQGLPENTEIEMVFSLSEKNTVLKEVKIYGEALHVETILDATAEALILRRLLGASIRLSER